jgi:hypothetical protein
MRGETDREKVERFIAGLAERTTGRGRVYITGGGTAVLQGWRTATIDLDIKADPEPRNFFEAIAQLKEHIGMNIELAAPDDFIPELPGWRERSLFITRRGEIDFFHYDLYSQALAKLERGHARDLVDVKAMAQRSLIEVDSLRELFQAIESRLIRFPGLDAEAFRRAVFAFGSSAGDGGT